MAPSGYLLQFHFKLCSPIPRMNNIRIIKYVLDPGKLIAMQPLQKRFSSIAK